MTNFIPIFPLQIIAYPGEQVNLHIFEPRYKQLIEECLTKHIPFGMPVVIDKKLQETGAVLEVMALVKQYDNGGMDISCIATQKFRILELITTIPDKLYSGAIAAHISDSTAPHQSKLTEVLQKLRALHQQLGIQKNYKKPDDQLLSYDIAHHAGLSLQQEYELLCLNQETHRLQYLLKHLNAYISTALDDAAIIERVQLNGHFRHLKLKDFNL
jgi:uncharacterized protein